MIKEQHAHHEKVEAVENKVAELIEKKDEVMGESKEKRMSLMMQVGSFMGKLQEMKESFWNGLVKALESMGLPTAQAEKFLYVARGGDAAVTEDEDEPFIGPFPEMEGEIYEGLTKAAEKFPFTLPVNAVVRQTGHFGDPRSGHTHKGVDIAVAEGTPIIVNAKDAPIRIEKVSSGGSGGNTVTYKTKNGTRVVLCHLQEMPPYNSGKELSANMVIGKVGNTGTSSGPHIHMEIGEHGNKIDPAKDHVDNNWFNSGNIA